ncbi:MAG: alpha/beta fold hydrolase [Proteobacteria bacterium]|nr:alpha/beta fold hydrolase [Pseudomonadota bacterium]
MRSDYKFKATRNNALAEGASLALQTLLFPFAYLPSRHETARDRELHTLVFVHGLAANRASVYPLQAYLYAQGYTRQYSYSYATVGSIEKLALDLKRRLDRDIKGGRIDIIGHSLGGLVSRFYLQALGGDRRVSRFVTLGTPHQGTHATAYLPTPLVRQMSPGSPFIRYLESLPDPNCLCTSIGVEGDAIVLPPQASQAPFGNYHHFDGLGHTAMLLSPQVLRRVQGALGPNLEARRPLLADLHPRVIDAVLVESGG